MKSRKYKFEIVTPLIMSGADSSNVELRTQSIKGMLRWWYRFLNGGGMDLITLKKQESNIFGSQEKASKIKLKLELGSDNATTQARQNPLYNSTYHLLGSDNATTQAYLCMNDNRNTQNKKYDKIFRKSYNSSNFFILTVLFNDENIIKEFENILFFINYFGGIGSRWRRGFGSVKIINSNNQYLFTENFYSLKKLKEYLINKLKKIQLYQNIDLSFTNLSNSDLFIIMPKNKNWQSWQDTMNDLRVNFYREFKRQIDTERIGNSDTQRASPLIIQIKKTKIANKDQYYGVIISSYKKENNDFRNDFYSKSQLNNFINSKLNGYYVERIK
jgi:CRISPR-associated protein Cmr1